MWKIVQELLPAALIILFLSQLVIPLLFNGTIFWLFKPSRKEESKTTEPSTLLKEIEATKVVVNEAKAKADVVIEKIEENLKSAEDLKKEAEKLK